jgi:hypothetical protein
MLNPSLANFKVAFSSNTFPKKLTEKYDKFLFQKNTPFKNIQDYLLESIQTVVIPGINLNTVTVAGLQNLGKNSWTNGGNNPFGQPTGADGFPHSTVNAIYPGTAPLNEVVDSTILTITFRNSIINWMYIYELFFSYYKRTRDIKEFSIYLDMLDSAKVPMIRFSMSYCFVATIPGLEFSFANQFNEAKTFDASFVFNKFDVNFLVPEFNQTTVNL